MTSNLNNFISFLETLKSLSTIYGLRLQVKTRPHFRGDKEMTQVRNSFCYHNNIQMKIQTFFVIIYNISLFSISATVSPDRECILRRCSQLITGRSLTYGRILGIILSEEYLQEVGNIQILIARKMILLNYNESLFLLGC